MREKIAVLEKLMHAGGHTQLILAGDPEITARVRLALPNDLAKKLVDVVPVNGHDQQSDALMSLGGVGCLLRYRHDLHEEKPGGFAQV